MTHDKPRDTCAERQIPEKCMRSHWMQPQHMKMAREEDKEKCRESQPYSFHF